MISESPMNTGGGRETLNSFWLFHSGGQNSSCHHRLLGREWSFSQYLGKTGDNIELTGRAGVHTSLISLKTAIKKVIALSSWRWSDEERYFSGEQNPIDCGFEPVGSFLRQEWVDGALSILADFTEERMDWEHEWSCQTCRIVKLTSYWEDVFLGDRYRMVLEKFGVQISSGWDSSGLLWRLMQNLSS